MEEDDHLTSSSSSTSEDEDGEEELKGDCSKEDQEDETDTEFVVDSPTSDDDVKSKNVAALVRGNLVVKRQSLLPRVLSVSEGAAVARKPFKPPCLNGYRDQNEELIRRLWARKRFVPWGSLRPALVTISNRVNIPQIIEEDNLEEVKSLPPGVEPLVLWHPEDSDEEGPPLTPIVVDPLLVRFLRPHQREGVLFMFTCVSGILSSAGISGCILADDMGLGKTLQSITLLYTLLCQGFDGKPMVGRAMIVTPTSLVSNWESEIYKWVGTRIQLISLCESSRADVVSGIDSFLSPSSPFKVLIISYETFRMHSSKFEKSGSCDLLICDEAHRLKNDQTLTNRALASLSCRRRVLLSGTPMQNDLEEFFAMVNFTNPGILGDAAYFRRYYDSPIISGREPCATADARKLGIERSTELSAKVNQFILRRTNTLLSNHLPPKIVEVVCCKLTPLQSELYSYFVQSKNFTQAVVEEMKQSKILAYITALKKLCNHPKLIYDTIRNGGAGTVGLEGCLRFFPPELFSGRSGSWTGGHGIWVELSGKMHVLARLLAHLRQKTNDRIVLVSNYTQTLDLFSQLCRERRYPYLRLDGTTSIGKRQKLVNRFNDPSKDEFAFLLSSKAGGCGLNLIGGNRLVLFDPDWNPANDKQAAARIWRDGQKKRVYIYRFLSTGTIEEKVYQRQMSKEGLQKVIQQEQMDTVTQQENFLSREDLRDLFTFHANVRSEIHENLNCMRCKLIDLNVEADRCDAEEKHTNDSTRGTVANMEMPDIGGFAEVAGCLYKLKSSEKQVGTPLEEDLGSWGHHFYPTTVPDVIFQASAGDEVTFVFTNQVDGKLVPVESTENQKTQGFRGRSIEQKSNVLPQQSRVLSPVTQIRAPFSISKEDLAEKSALPLSKSTQEDPAKITKPALKGIRTPRKSKTVIDAKLSHKRFPDDFDRSDDDFM
ncbi:protein CHROMATIN REMODELING 25 isoform X2 [Aristolochia californica]|uniref:protein CHROMATIN REMODELING 25 isoform X2 n=1 Tax=Aristolochia californica TaxID=171875 RepID=UPI0035E161C3